MTKRPRDADTDTNVEGKGKTPVVASATVGESAPAKKVPPPQPSHDVARVVYQHGLEERAAKVKEFIKGLQLTVPIQKLRENSARRPCPSCSKNRQYYCYDCMVVAAPETHPPPVKLPFDVHVLLHPGESKSKSTTRAASTLSPQMKIHMWPEFPEGLEMEHTALLYPSPQAACIDEMSAEELSGIQCALFVDSTWQQSKAISRDPRLAKAKHIKIKSQISLFWRFQDKDPSYLATIEAIYYFLREFITAQNKRKHEAAAAGGDGESKKQQLVSPLYRGEVDDLLFYYVNQYITIQSSYVAPGSVGNATGTSTTVGGDDKKEFTSRHFADYILSSTDWSEYLGKNEGEGKTNPPAPPTAGGGAAPK